MSTNGKIQKNDPLTHPVDDPLSNLNVFERLEVGPVKLEPKRLIAPYRLFYNGKMEQTELIYSYEETVFDPAEPESQNLANMIAAQVALNHHERWDGRGDRGVGGRAVRRARPPPQHLNQHCHRRRVPR